MYIVPKQFSCSAIPDSAGGGCGGHFPKWPLFHHTNGRTAFNFDSFIGFFGHRFQKKCCRICQGIVSTIF